VFRSTDGGDTWQLASTGLPAHRAGSTDPSTPQTLASINADRRAALAERSGLPSWAFSGIVVDPVAPNTLYVTASDLYRDFSPSIGIFRSTDGGETWSATDVPRSVSQLVVAAR
jgi:hypothetical protein